LLYGSVNPPVFGRIPRTARRILDVGCGVGTLARAIRSEWPAQVVGITHTPEEAEQGRDVLEPAIVADLNVFDPTSLGQFDCIVCSHVLEHLVDPLNVLARLRPCLSPQGRLIVALPNVLFWRQRLQFLRGRFQYTDGGLMDRTHLRFFDWQTARDLIPRAGLRIQEAAVDGGFPGSRLLGPLRPSLDALATRLAPGLFGWQFVVTAVHP